jgi:hypothetical protein
VGDTRRGMLVVDSVLALLRRLLPVAVPGGALALPERSPPIEDEGSLILALQSITTDEDGTPMDVREQSFALGKLADQPIERWHAYIEGTLRAAPAIVESLGGVEAILPHEVFAYSRVLADASLASADDFTAVLGDRERLCVWNQAVQDEAWRELLEPCGLADRVAEVRALLRPSLRLRLDEEDEDDESSVGQTRFGGDPDLPRSLVWPEVEGEPLVFVAQLDLAELARWPEARELPSQGLLSCFYAPIPPEGQVLEHPVAILHFVALDQLARRRVPEGTERLRPHAIEIEAEQLLPSIESAFAFEALLPEARVRAFYASLAKGQAGASPIDYQALAELVSLQNDCDPERPMHRLFGHPASIQGDPYLDVEMSQRGWDGWREGSDEAMALRKRALGWRLLLQIDAYQDDQLLLNQDGGFFYFWIPADALAAQDWSRARGCLQCH